MKACTTASSSVRRLLAVLFLSNAFLPLRAQQDVTITGRVLDLAGQPIAAVTVSATDLKLGKVIATKPHADGSFVLTVPAGMHVVSTSVPRLPFDPVHLRVDARVGDVRDVVLRIGTRTPLIPETPPRASRIHVSLPNEDGDVTITAAAGCVPPLSWLLLVTLDTGHYATTYAGEDGSFRASIFAPFSSSIMIKADSLGVVSTTLASQVSNPIPHISELPATVVRVAPPPADGVGTPFGVTGLVGGIQGGGAWTPWTFQGMLRDQAVGPGENLTIDGRLRILSSTLATAGAMSVRAELRLERLSREDGSGAAAQNTYASTLLTPTGLPIERERSCSSPAFRLPGGSFALSRIAPDHAEVRIELSLPVTTAVPSGYYVPIIRFEFEGVPPETPGGRMAMPIENLVRRDARLGYLPVIRVGQPARPRIFTTLLADVLSDGVRGVGAIEDRSRFALSSRIRMPTDSILIPRLDASGQPLTYNLEPFAPTVSVVVGPRPNLPLMPFRFPSGHLTVRIEKPDGSAAVIGPAPFAQPRFRGRGLSGTNVRDPFNFTVVMGGNVIRAAYQLTTLDPRFDVEFDSDGRYIVSLDGTVDDLWGNAWTLSGTYEIHVGQRLSLDTMVPGTPLEVGDDIYLGMKITPPVPAEVEARFRLAPDSDASRMVDHTVRGRANRFGSFSPETVIRSEQSGEYRIDVTARYVDQAGNLWMGSRTWGGVVAPNDSAIIAHGRRGMVNADFLGSQWYFRTQTPFPSLPTPTHPLPPFHSGDVMWAQKSDTEFAHISFHDPSGSSAQLLRKRLHLGIGTDAVTFDERARLGELPLFSSREDFVDPHIDPARVDLWGYSYRFIERPLVAVREIIAEDSIPLVYWGFNDPYAGQTAIGANGDLPNDFKFQFGGAVLRGAALPVPLYAVYGSLFVLVPDSDPGGGTRVFPPFQGNGGGPSGGPLFTLKGRPIDIFFHPTGIRPGSILVSGNTASFSGQIGPTLPSKAEITVTSPTGTVRVVSGQANKVGYFYDPSTDFRVDEPGVWRVRVKVWHDGLTSAGQVTPPFPTGDVLGSRQGEFYFYVVRPDALQLEIGPMQQFVRPADGPITFTIEPPPDLTNVEMYYTTTMPGFILEEGATSTLTYTYDAQKLAGEFPNLDLIDGDGFAGADTITLSFFVTGLDARGERQYFARQIVLQGEELQMPEQKPSPPRRGARRSG